MKVLKILIVMLILIMSAGAVCAAENITDDAIGDDSSEILENSQTETYAVGEDSFTNLSDEIEHKDIVDLSHNYIFNNETDNKNGIAIIKDNLVINGNGRTIDAKNQSRIFNITANNITLKNLILTGGNADKGGAIYSTGSIILDNITFINNYATKRGGAIGLYGDATLNCSNSHFIDNYAEAGSSILVEKGKLNISNSDLSSKVFNKYSQIVASKNSIIYVENVTFINSSSSYAAALYFNGVKSAIFRNSKFINLKANLTAGAIGIKSGGEILIKNCEFINATSSKNAGAVIADISGNSLTDGNVTIINTVFKDSSSGFGGAYMQYGGKLFMNNAEFTNCHATFNGGAVYISYVEHGEILNSNFTSNGVDIFEGYPTYGGAIFNDKSVLGINNTRFINNTASEGNAVYMYDSVYDIENSVFENNTNAIYTVFDEYSYIDESNNFNNDTISLNNIYYATIVVGQGKQLTLLNNTFSVDTIPKKFDLRDWGWVSPVRNQGWMGSCWTFGMTGVLESALLKAAGIATDFSENNMQNTMLRYSIYGSASFEGGTNGLSTGYLLSWLGAFTQEADSYDELGKVSPVITTDEDIHIQDVMFIPNNEIPNGTQLKLAIMKYGSIDVSYYGQSTYDEKTPYFYPANYAQYVNDSSLRPNHGVSIVGWDDTFSASKFGITPPGDGAWIVKNSWGSEFGDNGYLYVSYYDKTLLLSQEINNYATAIIIENTVPYNKNYQYDTLWRGEFRPGNGSISYYNEFEALGHDLIAGVGTYFNQSGISYKVEIFVNDELKLTQEGISPYCGYHTIKLNDYIPVKKGDVFKAVVTSNTMPVLRFSATRLHFTENMSFVSFDAGETWQDAYNSGYIACLKVYTVADPDVEKSFSTLESLINSTEKHLNLTMDYTFNKQIDNKNGIVIDKDNFTINGNGYTLDAKNLSRIFNITANNVTLSNLILINGNSDRGGAIYAAGSLTLDNVTFINNNATRQGGAIGLYGDVALNINNSKFTDNYAEVGSAVHVGKGTLNLYNTELSSKVFNKYSQISAFKNTIVNIENATFANTTSSYAPALYLRGAKTSIINSKFLNLRGNISSGAIGVKYASELYIKNCEFSNTTSSKNAGAILADIAGDGGDDGSVIILDTVFNNTSSGFAGAYLQFGGNLSVNNTVFANAHASFNGGSVYLSHVNGAFDNCTFDSNAADLIEDYLTYGGAVFLDMSRINITDCNFFNNMASAGSAVYAYDTSYNIRDSTFENNTNPIYTFFDGQSLLKNNTYTNDNNVSTNNTYFATFVFGEGLNLTLLNNSINVTVLPSRFDLRDWGWVSPVRNQGWMGACWTFGMTGSLESALLKVAGIKTDFSENNMQNTMLVYSIYGSIFSGSEHMYEGGVNLNSAGYLLSWLGAFTQDADTYDEMGKLSPLITTGEDIHVQDVMFTPNNEIPNGTQLKWAILKYGSIDVSFFSQSRYDEKNPYYNESTHAHYVNKSIEATHEVSVVGWDDNYPKENFIITPPGDGAWIVKNSWGTGWGDEGYLYVSYYDKSFLRSIAIDEYATSIIFENTVPYNKNYQYDIVWSGKFNTGNGNVSYMNVFEAGEDDLIAAVGTYFNQSGINYTVEIYVNDELKLTQNGVSPYIGYHTIKLDKYIPIKKGDVFKAKITSNAMPYVAFSETRIHYAENISFISYDGQNWQDCYKSGEIACLKVYTVADDSKIINNENITVDYGSGAYFSVKVVTADGHAVGAGAVVNFTINGKTISALTDSDGVAKIQITQNTGTYIITTTYNGKTYNNTVTVKAVADKIVLKTKKVTVKKTAKKFKLKASLKINGKAVKGKKITFKFKGKTYTAKTNAKGVAKVTIKKNVIKKLKKGKKYAFKVTYLKNTVKSTVKVK